MKETPKESIKFSIKWMVIWYNLKILLSQHFWPVMVKKLPRPNKRKWIFLKAKTISYSSQKSKLLHMDFCIGTPSGLYFYTYLRWWSVKIRNKKIIFFDIAFWKCALFNGNFIQSFSANLFSKYSIKLKPKTCISFDTQYAGK